MAYQFTSASSQYLSTPVESAFEEPFTIACWGILSSAATSNGCFVSLNSSTNADRYTLITIPATNSLRLAANQDGVGLVVTETTSNTVVRDTWTHAAAVVSSTTSRSVLLNGANKVTTTSAINPTPNNISMGSLEATGAYGPFLSGQIADVGIWNVALTDAEIASLAKGMACDKVRPQSLVFYAPLIRNLQDIKGGRVITNNNTATVANHPRMYR
jgi:hypothetical protein